MFSWHGRSRNGKNRTLTLRHIGLQRAWSERCRTSLAAAHLPGDLFPSLSPWHLLPFNGTPDWRLSPRRSQNVEWQWDTQYV